MIGECTEEPSGTIETVHSSCTISIEVLIFSEKLIDFRNSIFQLIRRQCRIHMSMFQVVFSVYSYCLASRFLCA